MQGQYPDIFERDMGCSEAEWLGWLPEAMGPVAWQREGSRLAAQIGDGRLSIAWAPLPPRQIALLRMNRLHVRFAFEGVSEADRHQFMRRFDLRIQRGGG